MRIKKRENKKYRKSETDKNKPWDIQKWKLKREIYKKRKIDIKKRKIDKKREIDKNIKIDKNKKFDKKKDKK